MNRFKTLCEAILEEKLPIFKTPEELLNWMTKNLSWGMVKDGKFISEFEPEEFSENYHYLSTKEIVNIGGGVCWDKSGMAVKELRKIGIDCKEIYFKLFLPPDLPTHSCIIIYKKDKVQLFECSWFDHYGIHDFKTEKELFQELFNWQIEKHPKGKNCRFTIYEVFSSPKIGSTCQETMDHYESGKIIFDIPEKE